MFICHQNNKKCISYVNKCKLKVFYERYLKRPYVNQKIDEAVLNEILLKTISIDSRDIQTYLLSLGVSLRVET